MADRIEILLEHALELPLLRRVPAGVGAQDLASEGEGADGDAAQPGLIGTVGHFLHRVRPIVEDPRGAFGMLFLTGNRPTHRIEIGGGGIVLRALPTAHVRVRRRFVAGLRLWIPEQRVPAVDPRVLAGGDLRPHAFKVLLSMEAARMDEGFGSRGTG